MKKCTNHTMYYSSDCEECKRDIKYNYMYESECDKCKNQMAFQAFTKRNCQICGKENEHHNGNTPTICIDCLKVKQCRKCGNAVKALCGGQNK